MNIRTVVHIPFKHVKIMLLDIYVIDCSKMARIPINTRSHTKVKPCMINLQFLSNWGGKNGLKGEQNTCTHVHVRLCAEEFLCLYPVTIQCEK